MKRLLVALTCMAGIALAAADPIVWKGAGKMAQWIPNRCEAEINNSNMVVYVEEPDSQLKLSGLAIDTSQYNTFSFRYRAEKTPKSFGQLFFRKANTEFSDSGYFRLPELIADGEWHTTTVTTKNLAKAGTWQSIDFVESLRFDPTDAVGGKIEISEIRLEWTGATPPPAPRAKPAPKAAPAPVKTQPQAAKPKAPAAVKPPAGPHYTEWNKANDFAGWFAKQPALRAEKTADGIKLFITGRDSQFQNSSVWIDQSKFNTVTITYRAEGISRAQGQFYVGTTDNPVHEHGCWEIGPFTDDGKWHDMVLTAGQMGEVSLWDGKSIVNVLRFDPTDGEGGWIELKSIKFGYDLTANPVQATGENLLSVPWPTLKTDYLDSYNGITKGAYFLGKMISSPLDLNGEGKYNTFYLRREFRVAKPVKMAVVQYVGDDGADLYVNGKKLASNISWAEVTSADVTKELKAGTNVLGFVYVNKGNVGGTFGELFIRYEDNSSERISTDDAFTCNISAPADGSWAKPNYKATGWKPVITREGPPHAPWTTRLDYHNFSESGKFEKAALSNNVVTAGKKLNIVAEYSGEPVALPAEVRIEIRNDDTKKLVWREYLPLTANMLKILSKEHWQVAFPYETPLYISSVKNASLHFSINGIPGETNLPFELQQITEDTTCPPLPPFTVQTVPGYGPSFVLGDKPVFALWGGTCNVIYNRNPDDSKISNAPFNFVTAHNRVSEWWPSTDKFDPAPFDRTAELYRRAHPDAYLIWDLTFRFPSDWATRYPDQMCLDENGKVVTDGVCFSFSSKQALKDLLRMVETTVNYLEHAPYRNRIVAYRINAGHTIEWLGWSPTQPGVSLDFSKPSREGFEKFARERYPELKDFSIPTYQDHCKLDDDRLLWDNKKHLREQAYAEYLSESVVDMLIAANLKAKELVKGKKAVGTYYAYTMTLNDSGVSRHRSHYAAEKLLNSGAVDFLMSPQTYCIRKPGDGYGDMKPFASLNAHNVMAVLEDDTRTHWGASGAGYHQTHNLEETLNIMRRNMGFSLCRQQIGYYYALAGSDMLKLEALERDMAKFRTVGSFCLAKQVSRHADVAIVTSEKNIIHQPSRARGAFTGELDQAYNADGTPHVYKVGGRLMATDIYNRILNRFGQSGASVDYLLGEDLVNHAGDYKLYIFTNAFEYDEKFLEAIRKLQAKPGVTLVWLYAPGLVRNFEGSVANMKELTGFTFAEAPNPMCPAVKLADGNRWMGMQTTRVKPLFAVTNPDAKALGYYEDGSVGMAMMKNPGGGQSIFYGGWQFDDAEVQQLVRQAGARVYLDSSDPMEANDALIAIHTRNPGKKTVKLPRKTNVIEVFSGKVIGKGIDTFTFDAPLHTSYLFYYGDDAEALLAKLK